MRILLTCDPELPVPPPLYGGIERIVDALVRELKGRGHTVGLVAHFESTTPADRLFAWPGRRSQHTLDALRNSVGLALAIRQFRPSVLHSFSRVAYLLPSVTVNLPKIMSYQRRPGRRPVAWSTRIAGSSLTFTGCSEDICRIGRTAGGEWYAIHNFVDTDGYTFQPRVPAEAPLVFLSRIERIKGAHTAIAVALRSNRRLLIAGNHGTAGEEGRYWESEIVPHLGRNGIEYVGPVNDRQKNALLGGAAAVIVPIEWDEPFGIVFAEALACGTPVISCPRGALPEIVRDGIDGFLVRNLDDACKAVDRIPEIDRADCRERVQTCFSSKVIVSKYEQLYHALAGPGRSNLKNSDGLGSAA